MDIFYTKRNNTKLFDDFDNIVKVKDIQNYTPIYNCFFSLNPCNYNSINLNNDKCITRINDKVSENVYTITYSFKTKKNTLDFKKESAFFKFIPIVDTTRYLNGKYGDQILSLPTYKNIDYSSIMSSKYNVDDKIHRENNQAYVDMFFNFLSSKLLNKCGFIHGINFYGNFTGIKEELILNVADDILYLYENEHFRNSKDILYKIEDFDESLFFDGETRTNKSKLIISKKNIELVCDTYDDRLYSGVFKLTDENMKKFDSQCYIHDNNVSEVTNTINSETIKMDKNIHIKNFKSKNQSYQKTDSSFSSRTSETDEECANSSDGESDGEYISDGSSYSSLESEILQMTIFDYPVQIVCLEKLDFTMDSIMLESIRNEEEINDKEWMAYLAQVIMMLIVYQKVFDMTHNDLHSNNIMYIKTAKKYIYYKVNSVHYKIPTYGKLFKIIDFGRSIYKYKDLVICSDSYYFKGDSGTQYNFPPYYNNNKPLLYPNKSFDLCRLGCSLYNYLDHEDKKSNLLLKKIINFWCQDDKGRNILQKKNGVERYEEFKLYKMIARTVNNKTPLEELNRHFGRFKVSKKNINKKNKIINIDKYEKCFD
jgi:hypothetical protein